MFTCVILKNVVPPYVLLLQVGSWYNQFQAQYSAANGGLTWTPGSNTGVYLNNQRATMLWYHDHT